MRASDRLKERTAIVVRALPPLDEIRRRIDLVMQRWPDAVNVPEDRDRELLAKEMLRRVTHWDWSNINVSRINSTALAIFDEERRERPDLEPVRRFYLDEITVREPGSFLDAMLWVYVESFVAGSDHTSMLAAALKARRSDFGGKAAHLVSALPNLFSERDAPNDLSKIMMAADDPFTQLREFGLRAPHASGLAHAAHSAFVERIGPKLRAPEARHRLFAWLMPKNGSVLQAGAGEAVEALLRPWFDRSPPEEVRHEISEAIIGAYNDPRLHRGGIWAGFDPALKDVLLRWLTKQDMKFFCDMVTATQDSHMWPPRRDFWLDLYDDGVIDEAWVAFGSAARDYAQKHLFKSEHANLVRRFGRQLDRGASTSLLVMRMGNKIVVDGCHNYKTHIFRITDPEAPKLYQYTYHCDDIMRSSKNAKSHSSIHNWKSWVLRNV